ncbi:hypothetical protein R6Q59_015644 [Mikania micrantha]
MILILFHHDEQTLHQRRLLFLQRKGPPPKKQKINNTTTKAKTIDRTTVHAKTSEQPYYKFDGRKILQRISPSNLLNWFSTFNEHQKKLVKDIGFGNVVNLKVDCIPTSLAFWLVQNYNEHTSTLNVPGCCIHITPELVNKVLRIPNGKKPVEEKRPSDKDVVVAKWRKQFKNTAWIKRPFVMEFFKRVS